MTTTKPHAHDFAWLPLDRQFIENLPVPPEGHGYVRCRRGCGATAVLPVSDRIVRPRPGDLERATRPHAFKPSGEHTGPSRVEVCDLCGLAQRGTYIHPEVAR